MRRVFALAFLFTLLAAAPLSRAQQLTPLRLPWDQWQLHDGNDPSCAPARRSLLHCQTPRL